MDNAEKLKNIQLKINELIDSETKKECSKQNDIQQQNNMKQLEYLVDKINKCDSREFRTGYGVKNIKDVFNLFLKTVKKQNEKINMLEENLSENYKPGNPFDLI